MARKTKEPRKTEFVGIPIDRKSKQRFEAAAEFKGGKPAPTARELMMRFTEQVEKEMATGRAS